MNEVWKYLQTIWTVIGGAIGCFIGGCDGLVITLLVFVVIDFVVGVACGILEHKLSSETCFRGVCRKVLIFVLVGVANMLDVNILSAGSVLRTAVIFFYLSSEGISLLENSARLGLPINPKLKSILEQLHDKSERIDTSGEKVNK